MPEQFKVQRIIYRVSYAQDCSSVAKYCPSMSSILESIDILVLHSPHLKVRVHKMRKSINKYIRKHLST